MPSPIDLVPCKAVVVIFIKKNKKKKNLIFAGLCKENKLLSFYLVIFTLDKIIITSIGMQYIFDLQVNPYKINHALQALPWTYSN